jgi:hypothetical protein
MLGFAPPAPAPGGLKAGLFIVSDGVVGWDKVEVKGEGWEFFGDKNFAG